MIFFSFPPRGVPFSDFRFMVSPGYSSGILPPKRLDLFSFFFLFTPPAFPPGSLSICSGPAWRRPTCRSSDSPFHPLFFFLFFRVICPDDQDSRHGRENLSTPPLYNIRGRPTFGPSFFFFFSPSMPANDPCLELSDEIGGRLLSFSLSASSHVPSDVFSCP